MHYISIRALPFVATVLIAGCDAEINAGRTPPADATISVETATEAPDSVASTAPEPDSSPSTELPESDTVVVEPEPRIVVREGAEVIPQTVLHLEALWPDAAENDPITTWSWSVDQPDGSVSLFQPAADVATPSFEANVAGSYTFSVGMTRQSGASLSLAFMVFVVADAGVHVELLWRTPGDANEADEGSTLGGVSLGSDLDLHTLMLQGSATWFDEKHDCYWFNTNPDWDGVGESGPALDRDDTDGAGPENMNVDPLEDWCMRVGVHYWDDWGYGASFATVRIYLDGVLAYEAADVELVHHDLWTVAEVCGDGTVTPTSALEHQFPIPF